jgi:hypothetical protein
VAGGSHDPLSLSEHMMALPGGACRGHGGDGFSGLIGEPFGGNGFQVADRTGGKGAANHASQRTLTAPSLPRVECRSDGGQILRRVRIRRFRGGGAVDPSSRTAHSSNCAPSRMAVMCCLSSILNVSARGVGLRQRIRLREANFPRASQYCGLVLLTMNRVTILSAATRK